MDVERENKSNEEQILLQTLRSEVNFLIYPFFALSRKGVRNKIEYQVMVEREGRRIEISWKVASNPEYGHPGLYAKEVYKAIEQIINSLRPPLQNPIPLGPLSHIAQLMGLKPNKDKDYSGWVYQEIKRVLKSIVATTIESRGAFYSKGKRQWIEDVFHLYDRVVWRGEELPDGSIAETNYLFLGSWYLDNINAGYVKPIDYHYYRSLESPIAQRLYEIIGVKLYRVIRGDLKYLRYRYSTLCQLLPIAQQSFLSKAKEKLYHAHQELIKTHFLSQVRWRGLRGIRDWMIYYYPGSRALEEVEHFKATEAEAGADSLALESPSWSEIKALVEDILNVTEDEHSRPFYTKLAKMAAGNPKLQDLIYRCLSEVKYEAHEGLIKTTKGAVFTDKLKRYCQERGIDLGLRSKQG